MQHWNQHFSDDNRENNIRRHDEVTNRQSDFNDEGRQQNHFNIPYRNEGSGRPYTDFHHNNDVYSDYQGERFSSQQPYNRQPDMRMEQGGRYMEQDWNNIRSEANDFTGGNYIGDNPQNLYMNTQNPNNYGETYNPMNRNFNPLFADDEGGFSGGYISQNDNIRAGFYREIGFSHGDNFYNRPPQSWGENRNMHQNNRQQTENLWNRHNNQNNGGHFGH